MTKHTIARFARGSDIFICLSRGLGLRVSLRSLATPSQVRPALRKVPPCGLIFPLAALAFKSQFLENFGTHVKPDLFPNFPLAMRVSLC